MCTAIWSKLANSHIPVFNDIILSVNLGAQCTLHIVQSCSAEHSSGLETGDTSMQCKSCQCNASALAVARKSGAATNVSFYLLCSRGGWLDSAGKWTMGTKAANPAECDPDGQRGDPCCHTASPRGDLKAVQLCVRVRVFFLKIVKFYGLVSFGFVSFCVFMPCRNRSNKLDRMLGMNVGSSCQFVKGCQINTAAALILSPFLSSTPAS